MRWQVHGERFVYESPWVNLALTDVEIPTVGAHAGRRFEHHVVRMPAAATGMVVWEPDRGVLLLWRHRFITDTWGWEVPAGRVDEGEDAKAAAIREVLEETGYQCTGDVRHLTRYSPTSGVSDSQHALFACRGAEFVAEPTDPAESERIEWVGFDRLRQEVANRRVDNGLTLTALLWCFTFGIFDAH